MNNLQLRNRSYNYLNAAHRYTSLVHIARDSQPNIVDKDRQYAISCNRIRYRVNYQRDIPMFTNGNEGTKGNFDLSTFNSVA